MRASRRLVLMLGVLMAACSNLPVPPEPAGAGVAAELEDAKAARQVISGHLLYRERIALPPDSLAVIELRETPAGQGRVLAEQRIVLRGQQVPIGFALQVDPARIPAGVVPAVRAGVVVAGRPAWVSEAVPIEPARLSQDLGPLLMRQVVQVELSRRMRCGELEIQLGFAESSMRLLARGEAHELRIAPSASGARYVGVDDPATEFWNKGTKAQLSVRGTSFPECVELTQPLPPLPEAFRAQGNEPAWLLELGQERLRLTLEMGARHIERPLPPAMRSTDTTRYFSRDGGPDLLVEIQTRRCADSMTGMPYPETVRVAFENRHYEGCGGDPASLLQGVWQVEDLDGRGIVDRSQMTLEFGVDGRVSGHASCNRFNGGYTLTGEGLSFSRLASTMMACPPALMQQEQAFLSLLQDVIRFELSDEGALRLHAADGRQLTARRR